MKSLNKILIGCALLTMASSLGVGLGIESKAETVKAVDYTQHEAYFYKVEVEASGNFYIYFAADGGDGVNVPAIENASPNAPVSAERLAEFNYLDKISFTIDGNETFLKDVKTADGVVFNKFTRWGCYGMNIDPTFAASFVAKKGGGLFQDSLITVYEGCELPTFAYGGGTSDTKESILTPVRTFIDVSRGGNVSQSFKIKGDITIGGAYTSGHRYEEGCDFGKNIRNINLAFQFKDYSDYDETYNIGLNGLSSALALKEKLVINGKTFDSYIGAAYESSIGSDSLLKINNNFWARAGSCIVDLNAVKDEITSFDVKKGFIIPQTLNTSFIADYDWNTAQANFENIKARANGEAYVVDRDYHFVPNGITGFTDQNLTVFHEHNSIGIENARFTKWSDAGYMLSLKATSPLSSKDTFCGIDGEFIKNYTFKNMEFYVGEEKLEITHGEQFFNLWKTGDFTTRIRSGADTFGRLGEVTKIVLKAGLEFPNDNFCDRFNAESNPNGQVVNPATEARKDVNCFYIDHDIELARCGEMFIPINHREYDNTEVNTVDLQGAYTRTDGNMLFVQVRVPDDKMHYANAPAGGVFLAENELANLNTLSKIHLVKFDGSEVSLSSDKISGIRYNQWGDKDFFIEFNNTEENFAELSCIREIIFDEGLELPDFGTNVKLVTSSKYNLIHINGTKYTNSHGQQSLGHWLNPLKKDVSSMKEYIIMNKTCLGQVDVKPIGDGDPNAGAQRIWLQPKMDDQGKNIYSEIANNTNAIYSIIFNCNMLGKIVLIDANGAETRMSELDYFDDACTVNIWDRPRGTITIKPMNDGFSYKNYAAIRLEQGLELPVNGFLATSGSTPIEYYELGETTTWYLNNQNSYGQPATIAFDDTEVSAITGGIVENVPAVPGKTSTAEFNYAGYWKDTTSGNPFNPDHIVEGDEEYVSAYNESRVEYTVTYLDETGATIKTVSVANASEHTIESVPSKTGYSGSWEVVEGDVSVTGTSFVMPTSNVTLKARYTANTYTLSFEGIEDIITVTYDQAVGELPQVPAKEHFKDGVWMLGEEVLTADTVWNFTEGKTATPSYTKESYTVTFDTDGGTEVSSQTVEYLGNVTAVSDPSKTGYTFAGWMIGGQDVDLSTYEVTGNVTITAKWTINTYTVTFVSDGQTVDTASVNYNGKVSQPTAPAKAGYTFGGWTLNGEVFDFNTPITENITLVAKWTINSYTITFKDGDATVGTQTVEYGGKVPTPTMPVKAGYTFAGWLVDGEVYDFDTPVSGDVTLVASWTLNTYTVTFVDGDVTLGTQTIDHGGLVEEPTMPVKEGYTFEGWLVDGEAYDFTKPVTSDLTIVVSWKEIPAEPEEPAKKGCGSSVVAASAIVTLVAGLGVALVANKKKED